MISFENDYSEGAHEEILRRLAEVNKEGITGYGNDSYCESAKEKIRQACKCPEADIYFLVGGTQTNQTVIDSVLQSYEGVIAAETGHVASHEAGAIEASGHKVLTLPQQEGKIQPKDVADCLNQFYSDGNHEHMVFPGMVYISHPTEYGTLYTRGELAELSDICQQYHIPLYLDGARLGYGLAVEDTDVTMEDIAEYCDIFYIGGTKVGAFCGEAVVFTKENAPRHFVTLIKQHGALLAKGRLVGVQFDALFTDELYKEIGRNAIETAAVLKKGLQEKGYRFLLESPTNQQFIILEDTRLEELRKDVQFSFWEKTDASHTAVRFATSWATRMEDVQKLLYLL